MDTIPQDTPSKQCNRCKQVLPLSSYVRDRGTSDGLYTLCKACKKMPKTARTLIPEYKRPSPGCMFIYVLVDSETLLIRYVGRTINPRKRLNQHTYPQRSKNAYLVAWVMDLRARGLKPLLQIIEEVPSEHWQERERYWIAYYREHDAPLVNIEAGGLWPGHAPETNVKLSASKVGVKRGTFSEEWRHKIGEANRGKVRTPEMRARMSQGKRESHAKRKLLSSEDHAL
jgi:GIY-YIG catalytic domain